MAPRWCWMIFPPLLPLLGIWGWMAVVETKDLPHTKITLPPWNPQRLSQRKDTIIPNTKKSPPPPIKNELTKRVQTIDNKEQPNPTTKQWLLPPSVKLPNGTKSQEDEDQSASFFFANVGPHGFEYRAVFHHGQPNPFNIRQYFGPMMDKFQWPDFNEIFGKRNKLVAGPPVVLQPELTPLIPPPPPPPPPPPIPILVTPRPEPLPSPPPPPQMRNDLFRRKDSPPEEDIGSPLFSPKYDIFRGGVGREKEYPKIFRFNGERVNIVEFERGKKMGKERFRNKNDPLDPGKVARSQFLVLHGGLYDDPTGSNELAPRAPHSRDPPTLAKLKAFFYSQ